VRNRGLVGWLFIAPALALTGVFFLWPLALVGWMSLHNWPLIGRIRFIGLRNYEALLGDSVFLHAVVFTLEYAAVITPAIFVVAMTLALLANSERRFVGAMRTVWFLPTAIGLSTASVLWVWMLNSEVGVFAALARALGLTDAGIPYLDNATNALLAACSMVVWKTAGFNMVLLLVGLQSIPKELHEAARIDGAGYWQDFRHVTLPLMRRTLKLALVLSVTGSLLAFDQFYIITRGGPQNGTISMVYWIYSNAFSSFRVGYAASMSIVLLALVLMVSVAQLVLLREADET
jgi:multiple sugar transport system permease protein